MKSSNLWTLYRGAKLNGVRSVEVREGDEWPDGARFEQGDGVASDDFESAAQSGRLLYTCEPVTERSALMRITFSATAVPGAPELWFCLVEEPTATPPAANVVAYADNRQPPGTVVSAMQFSSMMNTFDGQVGAVRWYTEGGLVHQVYVAPERRRENIGSAIIYAAGAVHRAYEWQGLLHADGRRTTLGERFTAGLRHPQRVAQHDQVMPDMD